MSQLDEIEYGKEITRFGNWVVTTEGIVYINPEYQEPMYFIYKEELWRFFQ